MLGQGCSLACIVVVGSVVNGKLATLFASDILRDAGGYNERAQIADHQLACHRPHSQKGILALVLLREAISKPVLVRILLGMVGLLNPCTTQLLGWTTETYPHDGYHADGGVGF